MHQPGAFAGRVGVKFHEGTAPRVTGRAVVNSTTGAVMLDFAADLAPARVKAAAPAVGSNAKALQQMQQLAQAGCGGCQVADLSTYITVSVDVAPSSVRTVLEHLNGLKDVELAWPMLVRAPLPVDLPPATQDYTAAQSWQAAAPDGLGILGVRDLPGGRGENTQVVDVEVDWTDDHEDLDPCAGRQVQGVGTIYPGLEYEYYAAHGTSVLGILVGQENAYGITGAAPAAACWYAPDYTLEYGDSVARAMTTAWQQAAVLPGDVIVMESQTGGPDWDPNNGDQGLAPSEWDPPTYDAIRTLAGLGVVVVEAAGNGYENLDDAKFGSAFDPDSTDSGAVMVGAAFSPRGFRVRQRMPYSNHGRRVDVQAWGEDVVTAGYGDLFIPGSDVRQAYTAQFAGTSSATPLVSGVILLVQAIQAAGGGERLTPAQMRTLLKETGTPQNGADHVGPQPDAVAAVAGLSVCGNGRRDRLEVCEDSNTVDGDGCSADCRSTEVCGNQVVDAVNSEVCDDGNTLDGDGCSATCTSTEQCGNSVVDATVGEACDDGNTANGDGCSSVCQVEPPPAKGNSGLPRPPGCTCSVPSAGATRGLLSAAGLGMAWAWRRRRKSS